MRVEVWAPNLPVNVVLVADLVADETVSGDIERRRDLEQTDRETLEDLSAAFAALGVGCRRYGSPDELARNADLHRDDIVLSIYGGGSSRNRMMLVPAICESFGLSYLGPDAYGRMVAQDKGISKRLAADAGLRTPDWRIARDPDDLAYAAALKPPVVVKPLLEGSSIGIGQGNLARTREQALAVAQRLLTTFRQPVLIESFIAGREVAYSKIQGAGGGGAACSEVVIRGAPGFFEDRLFDAKDKLVRDPRRTVATIDDELPEADRAAIERFLSYFGEYGYCRVDGRLDSDGFHFIEFTADAWLGRKGQFAMGFTNKGWTYEQVIAAVIASATPNLPGR